jgi:HEAT repeat protein/uncharacterized membrane protein
MVKTTADRCAKKLLRWKVIKEYNSYILAGGIFFIFMAIVLIAFEAWNTPKGQYADVGEYSLMILGNIFIVLLTVGVLFVVNMRYKTWKRLALSEPSFSKAVVNVLVKRRWKLNSLKHKVVIAMLGDIGNKFATSFIISALKSGDSDTRKKSIDAIGKIHDTIAIKPLVGALEDNDDINRIKAAETLDKLAWKPQNSTEKAIYLLAKQDWTKLINLGEPAVKVLISALTNYGSEIRLKSVITLGEIASKVRYLGDKAVDALIYALTDKNKLVRSHAARTLGIIGAEKAIEPLKKASKSDTDVRVVGEARHAIKKILEKHKDK